MERGMKGEVGALVSRIEEGEEKGDDKGSEGKELISFNTHTSSHIRINRPDKCCLYWASGKACFCANDFTLCVHVFSYVPLGRGGSCSDVYGRDDACVCMCVCADVVRLSKTAHRLTTSRMAPYRDDRGDICSHFSIFRAQGVCCNYEQKETVKGEHDRWSGGESGSETGEDEKGNARKGRARVTLN